MARKEATPGDLRVAACFLFVFGGFWVYGGFKQGREISVLRERGQVAHGVATSDTWVSRRGGGRKGGSRTSYRTDIAFTDAEGREHAREYRAEPPGGSLRKGAAITVVHVPDDPEVYTLVRAGEGPESLSFLVVWVLAAVGTASWVGGWLVWRAAGRKAAAVRGKSA